MKKQHLFKVSSYLKSKPIQFLVALIAGLAVFLFLEQNYLNFTKGIELDIQDWLMKWRNEYHAAASEDIALIWVDEATIKKYDGAPPPRDVEAKLVKALHQSGAKTIAFNFTFDMEREGTENLVEASKQIDSLIYGVEFSEEHRRRIPPSLPRLTPFKLSEQNQPPEKGYVLEQIPCQDLLPNIKHLGHIMFQISFDGAVRHIPLIVKIDDRYYPALSLIAVCLFKDVPLDGSGVTVKWGEYILLDNQKGWRRKIPVDKAGRIRLNYIGGTDRFEQSYSFWNLERDLNTEMPTASWRSLFSDKLVLLGSEAKQAGWTTTPFSRVFPSVAVHATAIDNILRSEFVYESSPWLTIFLALCFSGVIAVSQLWLFHPQPQKPKRSYWYTVVIVLVIFSCFVFLYVILTLTLFHTWGRFLNLASPLIGMLLAWILVAYYCYEVESAEKRRLERELELAREVQISLLPKEAPKIAGLELAGVSLPAREVGGDYFDYLRFEGEPNKIGIAVADVSGKGMKAAMVAVMSNCLLASAIQNSTNLGEILTLMNQVLVSRTERLMFTALCIATIDSKTLQMKYSNAGQCYPILKRRDRLIELEEGHIPLGMIESSSYKEETFQLESGDVMVFYTDGVIEAMNHNEEMYEIGRLIQSLLSSKGTAKDYLNQILKEINSFVAGTPQYDDLTLVIVKVQERKETG